MIKIQCNRCGKEIDGSQKVGYIHFGCMLPFDHVTIVPDDDMLKRTHYCEDCMTEIWNFMQNKPEENISESSITLYANGEPVCEVPTHSGISITPAEPEKKSKAEEPKHRYKIDYGKIMALKNAGWSVSKIAEEMGMAAQAVSTAIYQYKKRTEVAQQGRLNGLNNMDKGGVEQIV